MADDNFRSYRNRDPLARTEAERIASEAGDPLAELARLIGQTDPYAEGGRTDAYSQARLGDEAEADRNWAADEGYAEQHDHAEDRYAPPPPPPPPSASYPSYAPEQPGYENERTTDGRYFSGPAAKFNGFRDDGDRDYRSEQMPAPRSQELPAYAGAMADEEYEAHEGDSSQTYAAEDYYDEPARPRRRPGVVVAMAVFALVVVGAAGAFGYRAMFGGLALPALPPIIKAAIGPNRIMPSYANSHASNPGQPVVASAGTEHLVSREEQPVNVQSQNTLPHVVSTVPIVSGQNSAPAGAAAPATPAAPASSSPWPNPPPPSSPWPNPPAAASIPNKVSPAPPTAQTAPQSAAPAAAASTEPKRVHTVVIRTDQPGAADAAPVSPQPQRAAAPPPPPPSPRTAARPASTTPKSSAKASTRSAKSNVPLSIVPGAQGEAAVRRASAAPAVAAYARAPAAPMMVANAGPVTGMAVGSSSRSYAVQVTSRRSEAEAQAAFRQLRAKYPNQLGGREPIIRRADLGARGTYYRALVGPFAKVEEAAGMCSRLKAAGGNCLVQRN